MASQLNSLARENANSAAHEAFVEASKFSGGLTDRTRQHIEREAKRAWRYAFIGTYLRAGYSLCGCKSVVAPQFARCYVCGAWRKQPNATPTKTSQASVYVGESPFGPSPASLRRAQMSATQF